MTFLSNFMTKKIKTVSHTSHYQWNRKRESPYVAFAIDDDYDPIKKNLNANINIEANNEKTAKKLTKEN